ncbi:hypothetical protein B277_10404 [Janibacter hoylei PVAS-1]|uniref:Uncharacterized protein n=1 Tax=Janibacter hoylei PVAS-1 TaxID=1210046 RepID=K1E692_9MICO|nr:hypothetical protein [Janibacter hoylei]EKA60912.1 hypothetical protein B277_10404 [Janibacter hoylei PVAS-1]RWU84491.1 hypothetical protein CWN80_04920 [Janibacter hoylei PVAS-1]
MSDISRRTLAKGAAWTVPAVTVAAAAPSLSASTNPDACPAAAGWRAGAGSLPTWNLFVAPNATGGSRVQLNLGLICPDLNPPIGAQGFRFQPTAVTATDNSGGRHVGRVASDTNTRYRVEVPVAMGFAGIFDDFAYNPPGAGVDWNASHHLKSYDITYTLEWWSTPIVGGSIIQACTYTSTVEATTFQSTYLGGRLSTLV